MAEITYKLLRDILKELMPAEINSKSLQHLLLLTPETEKNLKDQKSRWPKEKNWLEQANKKIEEYTALSPKALEEGLAQSGICKLRDCCYKKGSKLYMNFEERLLHLVETVFEVAPDNRSNPVQIVVEMLQKSEIPQEDVEAFRALNADEDAAEIAKFLVEHVKNTRGKKPTIKEKTEKSEYHYTGSQLETVVDNTEPISGPKSFTNTTVPHKNNRKIIHREKELAELEQLLMEESGAAVLLSGTGGMGKTTLARRLYWNLREKFEQVGWVNYRKDLKSSLLNCMNYASGEQDEEKRWSLLYDWLQNIRVKTLLIIDNVDVDVQQEQDPVADKVLAEAPGWANVTILLTSRLETLQWYDEYRIGVLGGEENCRECCADLFCFYYPGHITYGPAQREIIDQLVARAGYHTYAIELLAKSARHENLGDYLKQIENVGFQFPQIKVSTDHSFNIDPAPANAADQLRRLFNLHTRSKKERQILLDFSVLPELISLSDKELEDWLGYTSYDDDLNRLESEGWITFGEGFSIHPLVRETMKLDFVDGKAPKGTAKKLVDSLECGDFCTKWELPKECFYMRWHRKLRKAARRKLEIADSVWNSTTPVSEFAAANILFHMGEIHERTRKYCSVEMDTTKLTDAVYYYKESLRIYRLLEESAPGTYQYHIARTCGRIVKLEDSLPLEERIAYLQEIIDIYNTYAADCTDSEKYEVELAQAYHCAAQCFWMSIHKAELFGTTVNDNLTLFDKFISKNIPDLRGDTRKEKHLNLLGTALQIRKKLAQEDFLTYGADLAETCKAFCMYDKENEFWARTARDIYQELETKVPGVYTEDLYRSCLSLASVLKRNGRREEAEQVHHESTNILDSLGLWQL